MPKIGLTQLSTVLNIWTEAGYHLSHQIQNLKEQFPLLYECIDFDLILQYTIPSFLALVTNRETGFDNQVQGGRGDLYRHAQQNVLVRSVGIKQIFDLVSPDADANHLPAHYKILDVLGGDGTLVRAISCLCPQVIPSILTSDLSGDMVAGALAYGLPALQQPAQHLLLKDESFNAVIMAYGSHHIPPDQRDQACQEAFRVLAPGGRLVFHDFEQQSPVTSWFSEVVDHYSLTGHKFSHFTVHEMYQHLKNAGFVNVEIRFLYDPFILFDKSAEQAQRSLGKHLLNMYGLVKLANRSDPTDTAMLAYALAKHYFRYDYPQMGLPQTFGVPEISISSSEIRWRVEMPRVAMVGIGTKQ